MANAIQKIKRKPKATTTKAVTKAQAAAMSAKEKKESFKALSGKKADKTSKLKLKSPRRRRKRG